MLSIQSGGGLFMLVALTAAMGSDAIEPHRRNVAIPSSADGTEQPCYVILPAGFDPSGPPVPLLVSLHTWSGDVEQRHPALERETVRRGWIYLFPHFRGVNRSPEACGSPLAQQDILDAVDWAQQHYKIDERRIYLTGVSGGGHMAMLMAGRYPSRWTAVSAWVGISDLAAWHARHAGDHYGDMIRRSCGGPPGQNEEVDRQYRLRSPNTWLAGAAGVALDLAAGIHDGHTGSVPIRHTLEAFNVVARAQQLPGITEDEIAQLSRPDGRLEHPQPSDAESDPTYGRPIHLRRTAGQCRVTIFEGGHERRDAAALDWLSRQSK